MFVPCFAVHCCVSFLVLQSSLWERESWLFYLFVFLVSCDCYYYVALSQGAVGLPAVCECGIS